MNKCIDCGAPTEGSARCPSCWDDKCGGAMKLTKEDLDLFDQAPPTRDEIKELVRLARLGLWAEDHYQEFQFLVDDPECELYWKQAKEALSKLPK